MASFDGVSTDAYTTPPLTSVTIDTKEITRKALDRLIERINEPKRKRSATTTSPPPPERIVVGYRLAVRESSLHESAQ